MTGKSPGQPLKEGVPVWHTEHQAGGMHFQIQFEKTLCVFSIRSHEESFLRTYQPVFLRQIHSSRIINIDCDHERTGDGLYTQRRNCALGIKVADCLPVYLFNSSGVCIIHCGWRGIIKGIVQQAAVLMKEYHYIMGAAIEPYCYEVQEDVANLFQEHYSSAVVADRDKFFLDLKAAARVDLRGGNEVGSLDLCTRCTSQYFHSYRRGDGALRNYAAILRVE